ncbi:AAA family ATPase [Belliella kenyensis]|uniref:AAA family ATPase n=1 Tax=Belliella kenyensis TaxID=1472724 RepID=A0ABV8EKV9_9BACT|nr:AAA family ATPase [Belliella kenyensis]MCH7401328.1 AAA family ATPase [Belliella kenyensis]MDN3602772.1 AAA family ATPase [Belliella kenyensis]
MKTGKISKREGLSEKNRQILEKTVNEMLHGNRNTCARGVLISGYAGSGKTYLIEGFLSDLSSRVPVLILRHFSSQKNVPYAGFRNGLSNFLSQIYSRLKEDEFKDFSHKLLEELGSDYVLALDYFPELSIISEINPLTNQFLIPKVENQVYPILSKIFSFISDFFSEPLFLFTDNLQWMDSPGANFLSFLLTELKTDKLIWIGEQRTTFDQSAVSKNILDSLSFEKQHIFRLNIKELYFGQTKAYIENQLEGKCDSQLVETCHRLCQGDFFLLQLIVENLKNSALLFLKDGLLHGEISQINKAFKGLNKQNILNIHMGRLTLDAQRLVNFVACAGSISKDLVFKWLGEDQKDFDELLAQCASFGLLTLQEERINVTQMHLAELVYQGIDADELISNHYQLAKLYHHRFFELEESKDIIHAANHLNKALPAVLRNMEERLAAEINYKAGMAAKKHKQIEQAKEFFKICNIHLGNCKWEEVSDLTWNSFLQLARAEYELGEYDFAEIHLDFLLERFFSFEKRIDPYLLKIVINSHLGRYRKAFQILKESLNELGFQIPQTKRRLLQELDQLKKHLDNQEKAKFVQQRTSFTNKNNHVLNLLYVGGMALHHTSDLMMTWASMNIILMSDKPGTPSAVKAIGYVSYARMLIISGEISRGFEYGKIGLSINQELGDLNLRCRVYGVFAFYVQTWKDPFADSFSLLQSGMEAGKRSGDYIGQYILSTHLLNLRFLSGGPLSEVIDQDFQNLYPENELTYYITHYQKSLIDYLMGRDTIFSIPRIQGSSFAAQLTVQEEKFYRFYVWAKYYFLFGFYKLAEKAASEADQNRKLQEGSPLVPANLFIRFLSITQCWYSYDADQQKRYIQVLDEILNSFSLWSKSSPLNYLKIYCLLQAEMSRILGNQSEASKAYRQTLKLIEQDYFMEGVTKELFAKHHLTLNINSKKAHTLILESVEAFSNWGAVAKANQLLQQYQAFLNRVDLVWDIDIETIQQELSSDLEVTSLIRKLMVLLLRFSGSSGVVVKLQKERDNVLTSSSLSLLNNSEKLDYPESLILYAHKTKNLLQVDDIDQEMPSIELDRLKERNVKSFLILPINITGYLSMVIYLENCFMKNWYSKNLLKWIKITSNQGAIILENAMIHEQTIQLNNDITNEMYEKQRLAKIIQQQNNDHLKDLMEIQDKERNRIASDLHDSLGSMLSTVRLKLNGLYEQVDKNGAFSESTSHKDTLVMLDESIEELRRIAHHMAPASLKKFGLKVTLDSFVEKINSSGILNIDLQILGFSRRVFEKVEISIFRICQELLQNTIKHSQATHATLQLIKHIDRVNILMEDNGKGMDMNQIVHGLGFMTIQSKTKLLGGTFEVDSYPNRGTTIIIDIPLKAE